MRWALGAAWLLIAAGCEGDLGSGGGMDAAPREAGSIDGARPDAGAPDAGPPDDAGAGDSGSADSGALDAAPFDAAPPDAGPACPAGMAHIDDFCMDRYEAPNEPGALPLAMRSALDGEDHCASVGKRLCTEAEWVRACEGPTGLPYPYGDTYVYGLCNDDETWISPSWSILATWPSAEAMAEAARLYQGEPSGDNAGCVSDERVYDLTGNVAEWVRRTFDHANDYDHVMKGCYWAGCFGGAPPSCAFTNPAHPSGFRSYEAGFRCCTEAASP